MPHTNTFNPKNPLSRRLPAIDSHDRSLPLVTVVMPCFNSARTLVEAVESVLTQSYEKFELLLIDDGSDDGVTPQLCDSLSKDSRIRVIHQDNTGLAGARNRGFREALGEYIALLDSDDVYESDKLAAHVEHFQSDPAMGLSFSYSRFMSDSGKPLPVIQGDRISDIRASDVLCRNPIGNGSAAVIRRAALQDIAAPTESRETASDGMVQYFDQELRQSEDVEFWLRLITTTDWLVSGIDRPLTRYRLSSGGLSADTQQQLMTWETFLAKAERYAPELVKRYGDLARAYQLRYLCRRSIQMRKPWQAARYLFAAFKEDLMILIEEPRRTLATAAACALTMCAAPVLVMMNRLPTFRSKQIGW